MNDSDLQSILNDVERVAQAAAQLLQSVSIDADANSASPRAGSDPLGPMRRYAREHPWHTLWLATGLGFLVGSMLTRSSSAKRGSS